MKPVFFVPERGDILWLSAGPKAPPGSAGRLAAVVLSPQVYNARVGLALVCPISAHSTGYPFEVPVPPGLPVGGVILADQASSLDWRARRAERSCALSPEAVAEVLGKLRSLLG